MYNAQHGDGDDTHSHPKERFLLTQASSSLSVSNNISLTSDTVGSSRPLGLVLFGTTIKYLNGKGDQ